MEVVKSVILLGIVLSIARSEGEEACETIPSEIHIIKGILALNSAVYSFYSLTM